ncbi:MAG: DUF4321 domain-containing protein [Clostridia bacterium]|nr:DUF4321 domain-containing protein [Clostridia bacterium]
MRSRASRNPWVLFILILSGIIIGGVIGDILGNYFDLFNFNYPIGMKSPLVIDLKVLEFTFGILFNVNFGSIIGMLFAIISYLRS